ncbi:MAG: CopG family transcriptional regulator [Clostridiales bacterium]|nr:CopG family transcriptional regulator [Clostridiales bacterium]
MKTNSGFRNVRLQIFVSDDIDNKLDDLSEIMGMHKNEIIRVAIANYLFGMSESVNIVRDIAKKEIQKELEKVEN